MGNLDFKYKQIVAMEAAEPEHSSVLLPTMQLSDWVTSLEVVYQITAALLRCAVDQHLETHFNVETAEVTL